MLVQNHLEPLPLYLLHSYLIFEGLLAFSKKAVFYFIIVEILKLSYSFLFLIINILFKKFRGEGYRKRKKGTFYSKTSMFALAIVS